MKHNTIIDYNQGKIERYIYLITVILCFIFQSKLFYDSYIHCPLMFSNVRMRGMSIKTTFVIEKKNFQDLNKGGYYNRVKQYLDRNYPLDVLFGFCKLLNIRIFHIKYVHKNFVV